VGTAPLTYTWQRFQNGGWVNIETSAFYPFTSKPSKTVFIRLGVRWEPEGKSETKGGHYISDLDPDTGTARSISVEDAQLSEGQKATLLLRCCVSNEAGETCTVGVTNPTNGKPPENPDGATYRAKRPADGGCGFLDIATAVVTGGLSEAVGITDVV
jgi:hypothetical protein